MALTIHQKFDRTQRELVLDIAELVYKTHGAQLPRENPMYLFKSQHPTEQAVLVIAEKIFEIFYGDSPDYIDDDLDEF